MRVYGARTGTRTPDPRLKRALLYQLSYPRIWSGWRDSNPYAFRHGNLNPARLPISPHPDMKVFTAWGYTYNPSKTPCYTAKAVRYNTSLSRRTYLVVGYPNGRWYQERDSNPYLAIISHLYWPVVRSRHKRWLCICPYNHQIRVDTLSALLTRFHHAGPLLCNCR